MPGSHASRTIEVRPALSVLLRERTRADHSLVEHVLGLEKPGVGVADLVHLLQVWRVVWSAVAAALDAPHACAIARAELADCTGEALAWLRADLDELGSLGSVTDVCGGAPPPGDAGWLAAALATPAGAWGVSYVVRGSQLGGQVLARRVEATPALSGTAATRFLSGRGGQVGPGWVAFRRRLDSWTSVGADRIVTVDAARGMFEFVGVVAA